MRLYRCATAEVCYASPYTNPPGRFYRHMPSTTTSSYCYVYVLRSEKDGKKYIGFSKNLRQRLRQHVGGQIFSTKYRLPVRLIYYEACLSEEDARRREAYLKKTGGRRFLAKRLKEYYSKL